MFTLFDLIHLMVLVGGAIFGMTEGWRAYGFIGGLAGTALGAIAGSIAGRLPFIIAFGWLRLGLRRSSTDALKARLENEYFVAHLIIGELLRRGEPLASFAQYANTLAKSENSDKATFGGALLRIWPELSSTQEDVRS